MDLSIVIPLYNEDESLPELYSWIAEVCNKEGYIWEVIFVDDGSKDNSWKIIEELSLKHPIHVKGISFRRNYGKSAALNEGFQKAAGKVVITMDADLQDSPDEIPELYDMIMVKGFDLVSGWKKKRYDPISKTIPSKFFNGVTSWASGIKLHDFNCGLKAYKHDVVKSVEVYGEMHRYIPVLAKWAGFQKITEKVVQHRERKYGVTKFGWERFINGFLDLMSIMFVSRFGKKPMHLFGTLGILMFFIGFVILVYLSVSKLFFQGYGMTERPLFYLGLVTLVIGTQLFLTGFLAELISRSAHDRNHYLISKTIG
ncbi:MAG: glycosyltransferase family 2 protein [Chitinophagales bacterium]|nr:glycosyltransferase family 2 protein [Chitinophagales bacterium]